MATFEWHCPFCNHDQIVTHVNRDNSTYEFSLPNTDKQRRGIETTAIRCANIKCREIYLHVTFVELYTETLTNKDRGRKITSWLLRPEGTARPQPDYIPFSIRDDYREACAIRDKSPKASATLARRCLQGMIRDFCEISKSRLIDEIEELRKRVDNGTAPHGVSAETMDAIDAVRKIGNIGAHMERDISVIVEVDQGEAQALIELLEMLFSDWYVARRGRQERLARIQAIASKKETQKAVRDPEAPAGERETGK